MKLNTEKKTTMIYTTKQDLSHFILNQITSNLYVTWKRSRTELKSKHTESKV